MTTSNTASNTASNTYTHADIYQDSSSLAFASPVLAGLGARRTGRTGCAPDLFPLLGQTVGCLDTRGALGRATGCEQTGVVSVQTGVVSVQTGVVSVQRWVHRDVGYRLNNYYLKVASADNRYHGVETSHSVPLPGNRNLRIPASLDFLGLVPWTDFIGLPWTFSTQQSPRHSLLGPSGHPYGNLV